MTITEHIRQNLLIYSGYYAQLDPKPSLDVIRRSQCNPEFEQLMRNRLITGALRYGLIKDSTKPNWNFSGAAKDKIDEYLETGNLESLVDAGNYVLLEFTESKHPKKHFGARDDTGKHCEVR